MEAFAESHFHKEIELEEVTERSHTNLGIAVKM